MMQVPAHDIFQTGARGPFRCDNCTFARAGATRCANRYIIEHHADANVSRKLDAKGLAIVDGDDCCDFIDRPRGKLLNLSGKS